MSDREEIKYIELLSKLAYRKGLANGLSQAFQESEQLIKEFLGLSSSKVLPKEQTKQVESKENATRKNKEQ